MEHTAPLQVQGQPHVLALWSKRRDASRNLGLLEAHSCRNLTEASERAVLILRRRQATKLVEKWKLRIAELDRAGVAARQARLWAEEHPDAGSSDAGTLGPCPPF